MKNVSRHHYHNSNVAFEDILGKPHDCYSCSKNFEKAKKFACNTAQLVIVDLKPSIN